MVEEVKEILVMFVIQENLIMPKVGADALCLNQKQKNCSDIRIVF